MQFIRTTDDYIKKAMAIHMGANYDYSKCEYKGKCEKVIIICPIHGEFIKPANVHLYSKRGCPICSSIEKYKKKRLTTSEFIERSTLIHRGKYEYDKVEYTKYNEKVTIKCPYHGYFEQTSGEHLKGAGCKHCANYSNYLRINYPDVNIDYINNEFCYLYVIRLYNNAESFYKVGITKNLRKRKKSLKGYKKEDIIIIKYLIKDALFFEFTILTDFKQFKYIPLNNFPGMYECFSVNPLNYYYYYKPII